jgi:hypothetical protein
MPVWARSLRNMGVSCAKADAQETKVSKSHRSSLRTWDASGFIAEL